MAANLQHMLLLRRLAGEQQVQGIDYVIPYKAGLKV